MGDDVTLGTALGVAGASTDDVYAAMDWLVSRQDGIEKQATARRLREGGLAMFDLSSSWVEASRSARRVRLAVRRRRAAAGLPYAEHRARLDELGLDADLFRQATPGKCAAKTD